MPFLQFFRFVACLKSFARELMDGLQHGEAQLAFGSFLLTQEASVKKRGDAFEHVHREAPLRVTYRLCGLKGAPSGEDRQRREKRLLALFEQLVTPLDRVPEGPLPLRQVSRAASEQFEAVAQAGSHWLVGG